MKVNSSCIRSADIRSSELSFTAHLLLKNLPIGSQVIICKHAVFQKAMVTKSAGGRPGQPPELHDSHKLNMEEGMRGRHKLKKTS